MLKLLSLVEIVVINLRYHALENFGGLKFWRFATDEANGEEYLGKSDGRSSLRIGGKSF